MLAIIVCLGLALALGYVVYQLVEDYREDRLHMKCLEIMAEIRLREVDRILKNR